MYRFWLLLSHQIFQRRVDRTQRCCSRIIQPGAVPLVIVKAQTFPYSDVTVRSSCGHHTLMFHLHIVGEIFFDFIMRVTEFVVARRGHFGGVDRHGGPDFSLRLFHFVVKHLEKDGARFGRLQFCIETPLDDRIDTFQ